MRIGPESENQLARLARDWEQGQHVVVVGATGSGKTLLARQIDQIRIDSGGYVVTMVCKLLPDPTITSEYKGWTRWKTWKKRPARHENKILLWPDTSKAKTMLEALAIQKDVFQTAFDGIAKTGKWTLHVDEALYTCAKDFLNMAQPLAMLHALGRSSKVSIITLAQRPSHIPLIVYSSASHAFIGRSREAVDLKRLSELGGKLSAKELTQNIASQGKHDFLWIPVDSAKDPETINLRR